MKPRPASCALAALFALAGCNGGGEQEPLAVSVIGESPQTLRRALAQGLVALDSGGAVIPALAERWIVTDEGKSYIFRLKEANWSNGKPVTAPEVAGLLRRAVALPTTPMKPAIASILSIVPMTGRIIEIRLAQPDPSFLFLLAMPEFSIGTGGKGAGPYFVHSRRNGITRLRVIPRPSTGKLQDSIDISSDVRVRTEDAALAVARFSRGTVDVVTGGSAADLPLVLASRQPEEQLKLEPARGLFGLAVASTQGPLKEPGLRKALSLALDRPQLVARFGVADWPISTSILAQGVGDGQAPAMLEGATLPQEDRLARARDLAGTQDINLRIALPTGPGMKVILAQLRAMWRPLGVSLTSVAFAAPADLRLINEVAPISGPVWYLDRLGCRRIRPCDPGSDALLDRALKETDPARRTLLLSQSEAAIVAAHYFIPIARPIRWSLVRPEVRGWRESPIALHPFDRLRPRAH